MTLLTRGMEVMDSDQMNPIIMALETSGDVCSAAVLRGKSLLSEHTFRHGMHLSERLIGHLEAILKDVDLNLNDVDRFAVGIGPGSFTGTRIGVMTAKTLSMVLNKPLIGINGLEAMASAYLGAGELVVVPMMPCRPGTVFTALYGMDTFPTPLFEPQAMTVADLVAVMTGMDKKRFLICGAVAHRYLDDLLSEPLQGRAELGGVVFPSALQVGLRAFDTPESDSTVQNAMNLVPLYISPPQITAPKTRPIKSTG